MSSLFQANLILDLKTASISEASNWNSIELKLNTQTGSNKMTRMIRSKRMMSSFKIAAICIRCLESTDHR